MTFDSALYCSASFQNALGDPQHSAASINSIALSVEEAL